ncbi:MAG: ABC transporter permease [Kiritimatiellae bacterium]|nr:ABC transporter permease [Kiritimatiellia bacterium]
MRVTVPPLESAEAVAACWRETLPAVRALPRGMTLEIDASQLKRCGGTAAALILELYRCAARQGLTVSLQDPEGSVAAALKAFPPERFADAAGNGGKRHPTGIAASTGEGVVRIWRDALDQIAILGEVAVSGCSLLFHPRRLRFQDTLLCFERAGINALPITLLIGFLLGLILAFMSAASLSQFGVEVYVADLIAIGLFRELGPIMTAIILAGRSGSAFAAEIGTMKVNEEIDALSTFGLSPVAFLALPRVLAATLVMPILTIFAVVAGLIGGVLVLASMQVPPVTYWHHVIDSSSLANVLFGLGKSAVFGLLVGLIGCAHGLQTGRTADAVGRAATASVVGSLVMITVFDGIFAVLSFLVGI